MNLARPWKAALHAAPLRVWAIVLAGPALSTAAAILVAIIWRGEWPENLADKRLDFLGWALLVVLANVTAIIVALAAVKVKVRGAAGEIEVGGSTNDRPAEGHPRNTYYGERE